MSYSVTLMQCDTTHSTAEIGNDYQNFPRPFRYFLFSMWVCLGATPRTVGFSNTTVMGGVDTNQTHVGVTLKPAISTPPAIGAQYNYTPAGVLQHILVSVDGIAQIAQVYVNDAPLALSTGGWTGSPTTFDITGLSFNTWILSGAGSASPGSGVGDVFVAAAAAPAAFFDLTNTSNRRKFINADLTPVDLGATATSVLGVAPQIWLTARSGVAANFQTNAGSGGGIWNTFTGPPVLAVPGMCVPPTPPPPPPGKLAMDDVVCVIPAAALSQNLISLRWSDDRGHSFGNYVSQSMGEVGEYRTSLQWQRLAYARDRVFEVSWSVPCGAALQGCWIDVTPAQS